MTKEKLAVAIFGIAAFSVAFCGLIEATCYMIRKSGNATLELDFGWGGLAGVLIVCSAYYLCKYILIGNDK